MLLACYCFLGAFVFGMVLLLDVCVLFSYMQVSKRKFEDEKHKDDVAKAAEFPSRFLQCNVLCDASRLRVVLRDDVITLARARELCNTEGTSGWSTGSGHFMH